MKLLGTLLSRVCLCVKLLRDFTAAGVLVVLLLLLLLLLLQVLVLIYLKHSHLAIPVQHTS